MNIVNNADQKLIYRKNVGRVVQWDVVEWNIEERKDRIKVADKSAKIKRDDKLADLIWWW